MMNMNDISLDVIAFVACLLLPFMVMLAVALHFVWRFISHKQDGC